MVKLIKNWWNRKKKWQKAYCISVFLYLFSAFFYGINELAGLIGLIIGAIALVSCCFISDFKREWIEDEEREMAKTDN